MSVAKPELPRRPIRYFEVKPIVAGSGIVLALTLAGIALACAQATSAAQMPSADQKHCAEPGDASKSLSDKLDQGGGVICPPDVDPGMKTPAPDTGKMPVIPPPGSPGGDPNVQPK